jgi:hypothetical protein
VRGDGGVSVPSSVKTTGLPEALPMKHDKKDDMQPGLVVMNDQLRVLDAGGDVPVEIRVSGVRGAD